MLERSWIVKPNNWANYAALLWPCLLVYLLQLSLIFIFKHSSFSKCFQTNIFLKINVIFATNPSNCLLGNFAQVQGSVKMRTSQANLSNCRCMRHLKTISPISKYTKNSNFLTYKNTIVRIRNFFLYPLEKHLLCINCNLHNRYLKQQSEKERYLFIQNNFLNS